jgi:NADP-dependent 3-hydroxy acid dehydrogenase YdfG
MSNIGIKDKVVVITGASSGLGEATARHLGIMGAKLVLAARRIDKLEAIIADLKTQNIQAIAVATDVTHRDDLDLLAEKAITEFGHIDVWVNNAGIMPLSPMSKLLVDEWDQMIDVNIKGVLYGIAAALPHFQKRDSGHFINISSVAARKVFAPIGTVYSATKFAVSAISEGLRAEVGPNIRTTVILPGTTRSELKHNSTDPETAASVQEFWKNFEIPAESVARAIAYAIEQPAEVDINEIVLRPTAQEF